MSEQIKEFPDGVADKRVSRTIDKILLNRIVGIPIFMAIMYAVFSLTFIGGEVPAQLIGEGFNAISAMVANNISADNPLLRSFLIDGIIGGVGGVITFMPYIVLLFVSISIIEGTGYMSRAVLLMDRLMIRMGLRGQSFVPMVVGFGCSVPAILATRSIKRRRDRIATMMIIPLMSCGAKLPIYTMIITAFFPEDMRPKILFAIYAFGVSIALLLVKFLNRRGEDVTDERIHHAILPYRFPSMDRVMQQMWMHAWLYMRKAGTVILAASIIMWILTTFPRPQTIAMSSATSATQITTSSSLENSYAGQLGKMIEPITRPLGFDWRLATAFIGALPAKELFISQLGVIFSQADEDKIGLSAVIRKHYTPLTGICIIIWSLIATPCISTFAATMQSSKSWRFAVAQFAGLTILAYAIVLIVHQIGSAIG